MLTGIARGACDAQLQLAGPGQAGPHLQALCMCFRIQGQKFIAVARLKGTWADQAHLAAEPDATDRRCVMEAHEQGFKIGKFHYRFSRGLAQAINVFWPGADNPELVEILRNDMELVSLVGETFDGINRLQMHGVSRVGKPS